MLMSARGMKKMVLCVGQGNGWVGEWVKKEERARSSDCQPWNDSPSRSLHLLCHIQKEQDWLCFCTHARVQALSLPLFGSTFLASYCRVQLARSRFSATVTSWKPFA